MRIAVFDYDTVVSNPSGKGVLRLLEALCDDHDFTVYSVRFDNPRPDRIRWRRVHAVRRPLVVLFVTFHLAAAWTLAFDRLVRREHYDIVQSFESSMVGAQLLGVHFCHRAYLRHHWTTSRPSGVRGAARWLYEKFASAMEPSAFARSELLVVPSKGLARELTAVYPAVAGKTIVVPNPVDVEDSRCPHDFDRAAFRRDHGLDPAALLLVFTALGHFERKGLPVVLDALAEISDQAVQVVVVGGTDDSVRRFGARAAQAGLTDRVVFAGMQRDPRPFLWAADAFVFPSAYETFSYVTFEAAASGLPVVVSRLYGVEDVVIDGVSGFVVERDGLAVADAIRALVGLGPEGRRAMGEQARQSVADHQPHRYVGGWRAAYEELYRGA